MVEGDIRISKEAVPRLAARRPLSTMEVVRWKQTAGQRQYITNVVVGGSQVSSIAVSLNGLASVSAWQTAAREAMSEWNRLNCSEIKFVESHPGDITMVVDSLPGATGLAAFGTFPADGPGNGEPGDTITVNKAYQLTPNNASTRKLVMAHELGHNIGFRHTNWYLLYETGSSYGAVRVAGTPDSASGDPASIMNGGSPTSSWNGLSIHDKTAATTVYPQTCVSAGLSSPSPLGSMTDCTFTASASGGTTPYTYHWSVTSLGGYSFSPSNQFGSSTTFTTKLYNTSYSDSNYLIAMWVLDANGKSAQIDQNLSAAGYGQSYDYSRCA